MSDDLKQPDERKFVESVTTDSTVRFDIQPPFRFDFGLYRIQEGVTGKCLVGADHWTEVEGFRSQLNPLLGFHFRADSAEISIDHLLSGGRIASVFLIRHAIAPIEALADINWNWTDPRRALGLTQVKPIIERIAAEFYEERL